jgi:hypothetical protein
VELMLKCSGASRVLTASRGWQLGSAILALLTLGSCAGAGHLNSLPNPPAATASQDSRDSIFFRLLPVLVYDARDSANRAWPVLIDLETFAAVGDSFVGHRLSRPEIAAALNHPLNLPASEISARWPAGGELAAGRAIHLRLEGLEATDSGFVATMVVLYMIRRPDGSNHSDSAIYALTYERAGSEWRLKTRRALLVT